MICSPRQDTEILPPGRTRKCETARGYFYVLTTDRIGPFRNVNWFISGISIIQLLEKHISSGLLFVVFPGEVKAVKEELGRISAGCDGPGRDFSVLIENGDDLDTIAVTQQGPA